MMSSKVFAFNIAEYQEPVKVEGYYDPEEQLWVNGSGVSYATIAYQTGYNTITNTYYFTGTPPTAIDEKDDHSRDFKTDYWL
jgi:hypothetical protein